MTYFEMLSARESCRDYDSNRPVEREKLIKCLEAARLAPSACNSQPWKFYAVTREDTRKLVAAGVQDLGMNAFASACPALVAVVEERPNASEAMGAKVKKQDFVSVDIGLAVSQFCYQALEEGLSTCILGWLNEKKASGGAGPCGGKARPPRDRPGLREDRQAPHKAAKELCGDRGNHGIIEAVSKERSRKRRWHKKTFRRGEYHSPAGG